MSLDRRELMEEAVEEVEEELKLMSPELVAPVVQELLSPAETAANI